MATVVTAPAEQRIVLRNVSWETYERLLAELAECSSPGLTFDRGTLEFMSPSEDHEEANRILASLLDVVIEELDIDARTLGSTTFRREDLERGFEPDSCFYIQNVARVKGKRKIDLRTDPPPDLVIEVDISSSSLDKLSIHGQLGVPEAWRYDGERLTIHILSAGAYRESGSSPFRSWAPPGSPSSSKRRRPRNARAGCGRFGNGFVRIEAEKASAAARSRRPGSLGLRTSFLVEPGAGEYSERDVDQA